MKKIIIKTERFLFFFIEKYDVSIIELKKYAYLILFKYSFHRMSIRISQINEDSLLTSNEYLDKQNRILLNSRLILLD
jgi:uncharacterized protein YqgQ